MSFNSIFKSKIKQIDDHLNGLIPEQPGDQRAALFEAARYALLSKGKRLRPILTLLAAEALGCQVELALTPACVIELIHTYSLIHDDMPCMDNDDYRRGQLTVHKKYSEGHALLTGDYLLTYAFELLATAPRLSSQVKVKLMTILTKQGGCEGMIGGQLIDLSSEGKTISLDILKTIHRCKTAALLTAALEFAAVIANATTFEYDSLKKFGEKIGLAFQVVDDILDVTESHSKHGHTLASDVRNQKATYVSILGIERAKEHAITYYNQAKEALKLLTIDKAQLLLVCDLLIKDQIKNIDLIYHH